MSRHFPVAAAITAAALALVACGQTDTPAPHATPTPTAADHVLMNRIAEMAPGQRDALLFRAIRDARQECQGIEASARIDDVDGRPAWSAQCDNGARFLLVLNPNETFVVRPASQPRR